MRHHKGWSPYLCAMHFDEYLQSKKIDPIAFRSGEQALYQSLKQVYDQTGQVSFTQQKLFLINPLRRKYTWTDAPQQATAPKPIMKPKLTKPKI